MKKNSLLLLLLLCIPWSLSGQSVKNINLYYDETDFKMVIDDGLLHVSTSKYQSGLITDINEPALPFISVNLLVAPDFEYAGHGVSLSDHVVSEGVVIAPTPAWQPANGTVSEADTAIVRYDNRIYPDSSVVYTGTHLMDGYKFLSFLVSPFRYDASRKTLFLASHINIQISPNLAARNSVYDSNFRTAGTVMHDLVRGMVINGDEMDALYGNAYQDRLRLARTAFSNNRTGTDYNYEYLIITNSTLSSSFQRLADWKTKKGVRTKVLTVEEIDNSYSGNRQQLRIKQAIKDFYNNSQCGLKYVLLGGDVDVVPAEMCYVKRGLYIDYTPTDIFYACLDIVDWDTNGNDTIADINDVIDIVPELYVTRMSASTTTDVETLVNRVISYEKYEDLSKWEKKILMAGAMFNKKFYLNGDTISDTQLYSQRLYQDSIAPYWNGARVRLYDTETDFSGGAGYDCNAQHLQEELGKGYTIADIECHGGFSDYELEGDYFWGYLNGGSVNNSGYTALFTSACHTNMFDYSYPCLSEYITRNNNSGIIAYIGSSRYSWVADEYHINDDSNGLDGAMYKDLFTNSNKSLGGIVTRGKQVFMPRSNQYNVYRWLYFSVNVLGDPEMPIYIDEPKRFENVTFSFQNNSLLVNTGLDSCRICVTSAADNGASYYQVWNQVSSTSFPIPSDSCVICVTKTGYSPYIVKYLAHDTEYIQNETIAGDTVVIAKNVFVGSDVTTSRPQGPVTVSSGKTRIFGEDITLKNNFTVVNGAELYIGN